MKIGTIRIPCANLNKAEEFYSNKLGLSKIFGSAEKGIVGYQLENVQIIIEPKEKGEFECGHFLGFSIETDYIDDFYVEKQNSGVEFTCEPEKQFWGGLMTHIIDCSGNSISIVQPVA